MSFDRNHCLLDHMRCRRLSNLLGIEAMPKERPHVRFGRELRRRRESVGMTLEALAQRAGLTPNFIGAVETGKRDPSLSTILALAKGLGIKPAELLGTMVDLSPRAEEVARLFDVIAEEIQHAIMAILRTLVKPTPK